MMIQVQELKKRYGDRDVVRGVTFEVEKGESFGLLGPNGAGKSTSIGMICGLVQPDGGDVLVDGVSIRKNPTAAKLKIGLVPQDIALYPTMSARENLLFWGQMYGMSGAELKKRGDEVLDIVGLRDRAKDAVGTFSGGMKRRINIGAALMHRPQLLIMDEPTVGIDPQSRNHILETVKELSAAGMTVIYTSHYMEEVEYLCERVAIVDHGELIALGTKQELCNRLTGGSFIKLSVAKETAGLASRLETVAGVQRVVADGQELTIFSPDAREILGDVVTATLAAGGKVSSVDVQEPNLETVFLHLTGRTLRD